MDNRYIVSWSMEVEDENPSLAALQCAAMLQDPHNIATVYKVTPVGSDLAYMFDAVSENVTRFVGHAPA